MNWDAIGAFGEIAGAIGVIVSVIYLAVQVRKQTEESRLEATRSLAGQYQAAIGAVADDKELSEIWLKAIKDYESLQDSERLRASLQFQRLFRVLEQQYLHTKRSSIDGDYFISIDHSFTEALTFPGVRRWWTLSDRMFEKGFRDYIESMIKEADERGYSGSFGTAETPRPNRLNQDA
jgi:hypothetical protein